MRCFLTLFPPDNKAACLLTNSLIRDVPLCLLAQLLNNFVTVEKFLKIMVTKTYVSRRGVTWLDGARVKKLVWRPMFEPEIFWKQMHCIEESTCYIDGTFRRSHSDSVPGELCPPCPPSLRPWFRVTV